jgi:hypothetical protein
VFLRSAAWLKPSSVNLVELDARITPSTQLWPERQLGWSRVALIKAPELKSPKQILPGKLTALRLGIRNASMDASLWRGE